MYQANKTTKNVYSNLLNLVHIQYRMNTIFINSKSIKTSDDRPILNSDKYIALYNVNIYNT